MIALEDCIALCGLTPAEVDAIAEHEHIPEIAAATLARYMASRPGGLEDVRRMIAEDIRAALNGGHIRHAAELVSALRHLLCEHPDCLRGRVPGAPDPD